MSTAPVITADVTSGSTNDPSTGTAFHRGPSDADDLDDGAEIGGWRDFWRRFRRNRLALVGLIWIVILALAALLRPLITFYDVSDPNTDWYQLRPSGKHWFGTDDVGNDIYTRIVYGSWVSLRIGLIVVACSVVVGLTLGALSGYLGGWVDTVISRSVDIFLAVPYVIVGVVLTTILGQELWVIVLTLVLLAWMPIVRLFRSSVLQTRSLDYIEAARASGAGRWRILSRHILPNAVQPVIVAVAFAIGGAILTETVFSFLGIGLLEPTPAWGLMIRSARNQLFSAPHVFFFPSAALVLTVLSFALVGDGVRDALDPKLRGAN